MSDAVEPTAPDAAEQAAEAVRALNHHTLDPAGTDAADLYATIGSLEQLVMRLPQALDQLARVLEHPDDGAWATDDGSNPSVRVHYTAAELRDAAAACESGRRHLAAAHENVSHLYQPTKVGGVAAVAGEPVVPGNR